MHTDNKQHNTLLQRDYGLYVWMVKSLSSGACNEFLS